MNKTLLTGIFALMALNACAVIDPGERAVKVSMGVMDKNVLPPGMQTFNPFMESLHYYSVKQSTVEGKCNPLTSDQQPITITYKVLYRIPENKVTELFSQYSGDPYGTLVDPQVQEAFRQVISQYKADQATKSVDSIKNQILDKVQTNLKGLVEVSDIPITHIDLPEVLQTAIAEKQVMEQQSLQKQYELDKAKKEADITVVNAKAQAESQLASAEAEAKAIQIKANALARNPQLIEYTKAQKWNGVLPQTMLGAGANYFFSPTTSKPQE